MVEIGNTHQAWWELSRKYFCRELSDTEITVYISQTGNNLYDVTNLRYFFPLENGIREQNILPKGKKLRLNIKYQGSPNNRLIGEMRGRIEAFLFAAAQSPMYEIYIFGSVFHGRMGRWDASNIFPIFMLSGGENTEDGGHYSIIRMDPSEKMDRQSSGGQDGLALLSSYRDSLKEWVIAPQNYRGTRDFPLPTDEKRRLAEEMRQYIDGWAPRMDVLSQIIWLYILRILVEEKQLWSISKIEKKAIAAIDMNVAAKCRMDAVSYGEGMYQLIENACLHSEGKKAWFGFRVYCAGRDVPMGRFSKEAKTREILYTKYLNCFLEHTGNGKGVEASSDNIFNQDYRFFFEMYVLDDAHGQNGLVPTYNDRFAKPIYKKMYEEDREEKKRKWEEENQNLPVAERTPFPVPEYDGNVIQNHGLWIKARNTLEERANEIPGYMQTIAQIIDRDSADAMLQEYQRGNRTLDDYIDETVTHYGLYLLKRIVNLNNGYLMCKSPNKFRDNKLQQYYNGNPIAQDINEALYNTEWYALMPISRQWPDNTVRLNNDFGGGVFGDTILRDRSQFISFDCRNVLQPYRYRTVREKVSAVREIAKRLRDQLEKKSFRRLADAVILIKIADCGQQGLELFAKALFSVIAYIQQSTEAKENGSIPLRIALCFSDVDLCNEFVRLFSMFYFKDEQREMEETQIAVCSHSDSGQYSVNFVLAGRYLSTVMASAMASAYYGCTETLARLPVLSYLTQSGIRNSETYEACPVPLFPFDLYLKHKDENEQKRNTNEKIDSWKNTWFLERIRSILETDIQSKECGCLINDIHIRLGSKLHLSKFYEAQLLFHDSNNIIRFAYLVTHDLLYGHFALTEKSRVVLIGYEKYSAQFVQQIAYWLRKNGSFTDVLTAIVRDGEGEGEVLFEPFFDMNQCVNDVSVEVVSLLPVGTTLSTIYKIHNAARKHLPISQDTVDYSRNYCMVLVNKELEEPSHALSAVSLRYWADYNSKTKEVTLNKDGYSSQNKVTVKYLLPAFAQWYASDDCALCRRTAAPVRPIISVTKSEIMPGAIFLLRDRQKGFFTDLFSDAKDIKDNNDRIQQLLGNIWYSHIYRQNNHYQFYLNFNKFYRENRKDIVDYIRKTENWQIETGAYNILVSPVQVSNAPFVQDVLDCIFHGNARFIHIDFLKAYREEIRTTLSYVAEEFKILRRSNPRARICVYFADTSIVTGSVLNRARLLLQMLLRESGIDYEDVRLFRKVFLLVNRCSYDTANSFVQEPKTDLCAYIHLTIPSYNIDEGMCPACKLTVKYRRLKKRSATEKLSKVFLHLEQKHKKRTMEEYSQWLREEILTSSSYLNWLQQWLYTNVIEDEKKQTVLSLIPKEQAAYYEKRTDSAESAERLKEEEYQKALFIKNVIRDFYLEDERLRKKRKQKHEENPEHEENREQKTLEQIVRFAKEKNKYKNFEAKVVSLILTHLVGVRNYMRLYSMHCAYLELESAMRDIKMVGFEQTNDQYVGVRKAIVKLIARNLDVSIKSGPLADELADLPANIKERFRFVYRVEWLISYVKVLSREHIVNHYAYRQAIVSVMGDLTKLAGTAQELEKNGNQLMKEDQNWKIIVDTMRCFHSKKSGGLAALDNEVDLRASLQYQVNMMLLHRMADLQERTIIQADHIYSMIQGYQKLSNSCEGDDGKKTTPVPSDIKWICLPSLDVAVTRYLKSLKAATMTLDDDIPCLALTHTIDQLSQRISENGNGAKNPKSLQSMIDCGRYIYLENIRMIYSGMSDLRRRISDDAWQKLGSYRPADNFRAHMLELSGEVNKCLSSCYSNLDIIAHKEDILYQNPLSNFCIFWHESNKEAPIEVEHTEGENGIAATINPVAYMLQYYKLLNELNNQSGNAPHLDDLPYQYEELCRTICGFTGAKMCYMVYYAEGNVPEIFAQSGYYVPYMKEKRILSPEKMDQVMENVYRDCNWNESSNTSEFKNESNSVHLLPGITQLEYEGHGILALKIPLLGDCSESKCFYVVLQRDDPYQSNRLEICTTALRHARDILFMRETLQETLSRHYTILINFRFDCSYIRPMVAPLPNHVPSPEVLHISDVHVAKEMSEYPGNVIERVTNRIGEKLAAGEKIDLLTITGDIADGKEGDGIHLANNYRSAEALLDAIVVKLWADETQYISHDWRRRVIITTGNHDYASMNQFKAVLKQRVLSVGTPVDGDGGTMSKFAYFIEFLIRYLDPPIDELLRNDLNEIRNYHELNLKVLCLNCSSGATPRRTNKVGPDYEKVKAMLKRQVWTKPSSITLYSNAGEMQSVKPFKLCLAHYSDNYRLSYFEDNYGQMPGWEWDAELRDKCVINEFVSKFVVAMECELSYLKSIPFSHNRKDTDNDFTPSKEAEDELKRARRDLCEEYKIFVEAIRRWENGEQTPNPQSDRYFRRFAETMETKSGESRETAAKRYTDNIRKNLLFQEISYYYNWVQETQNRLFLGDRTDERISRLMHEINESQIMSAYDRKEYQALFNDSDSPSNRQVDLLLAGHIHAYAESSGTLVASKLFFENNSEVNGYIIKGFAADSFDGNQKGYEHTRL